MLSVSIPESGPHKAVTLESIGPGFTIEAGFLAFCHSIEVARRFLDPLRTQSLGQWLAFHRCPQYTLRVIVISTLSVMGANRLKLAF